MGTLVGVIMVIVGATMLAMVRPWQRDPLDDDEPPARPIRAVKRHHLQAITIDPARGRRVPPAPGREEIVLPHWLGPVSGDRLKRDRALAD